MKLIPGWYTVYRLAPDVPLAESFGLRGLSIKAFEPADLDRFFACDELRWRTFTGFLAKGYRGVLVHAGGDWAGYGWITTAQAPGPPHLPARIGQLQPLWLFSAHTRSNLRGRGIQKAMLRERLRLLTTAAGRPDWVYADTALANVPSRRALLALGFEPCGALLRMELPFPFSGYSPLSWWFHQHAHPPMPLPVIEAHPLSLWFRQYTHPPLPGASRKDAQ